jgi:hypothetical protein
MDPFEFSDDEIAKIPAQLVPELSRQTRAHYARIVSLGGVQAALDEITQNFVPRQNRCIQCDRRREPETWFCQVHKPKRT